MKMHEIINRWGHADFSCILKCEFCDSYQFADNCYNDKLFHDAVIPAIKCMNCEKRSQEELRQGISDPGYQYGEIVEPEEAVVFKWKPKFRQ